jgi:xanthine dehydrogenase accessory factor
LRELLTEIRRWFAEGRSVALATVVHTWGSAPRAVGSKMAVSDAGAMTGSVSGGCVEGAIVEESLAILREGRPRLLRYGVSDETAWSVGLACGGTIEVFVEPLPRDLFDRLAEYLEREEPVVRAVVVRGAEPVVGGMSLARSGRALEGSMDPSLQNQMIVDLRRVEETGLPTSAKNGEVEVFFDPLLPPPTLVMVGAVHVAIALTRMAKVLGLRVIIVDPRRAFATEERFPEADRLVKEWPDAALRAIGLTPTTAVAVLSHDPKLDDPALLAALTSRAFYVGALGSARTNAARMRRLREAGLTEAQLARLHAPIGLDIQAGTPEEIAVSILAEIIAARRGKDH